jgi:hypothetical protein
MNNLEPRAKIDDVVIILKEGHYYQLKIDQACNSDYCSPRVWAYIATRNEKMWPFEDKDILKNLTTNKSYE